MVHFYPAGPGEKAPACSSTWAPCLQTNQSSRKSCRPPAGRGARTGDVAIVRTGSRLACWLRSKHPHTCPREACTAVRVHLGRRAHVHPQQGGPQRLAGGIQSDHGAACSVCTHVEVRLGSRWQHRGQRADFAIAAACRWQAGRQASSTNSRVAQRLADFATAAACQSSKHASSASSCVAQCLAAAMGRTHADGRHVSCLDAG